jgi:microcompartment protein CcmK/EutM
MRLARVAGTVVSTINAPVFDGRKLLLCDLLDLSGAAGGGYLIAVDTVGAGSGETVLLMDEGNSARQILGAPEAPVRTLVVGIVDHVEPAPEPVAAPARRPRRSSQKTPRPARRSRGRSRA